MRLFLDANVIFSAAHNPQGRAGSLFLLQRDGHCELVASAHALEEARRNIALKYPSKTGELETLAGKLGLVPEPEIKAVAWAQELGLPLNDAPILAAAVAAGADVLVTGDRTHFGPLYNKRIRGVDVLPPAEILARLLTSSS
jgi:predicted nucleic acid-binding protein